MVTDGRILKSVIQSLIKESEVITDNYFIKGKKAKGYKLGPRLQDTVFRKTKVTNKNIARRLLSRRLEEYHSCPDAEVYKRLHHWFSIVDFDHEKALSLINPTEKNANLLNLSVQMFKDKHLWFSVCDYGRIHTNITGMSKRFRHCLNFKGQKLIEIDIRNSQPFFLGLLLSQCNVQMHKYSKLSPFPSPPSHYSVKTGIDKRTVCDFTEYLRDTAQGGIYERLSRCSGIELREVKEKLFAQAVFCQTKHEGKLASVMEELYPSVMDGIRHLKRRDYRAAAAHLQKFESNIVINTVCRDLDPSIPLLTIHDSILTTAEHIPTVLGMFRDVFSQIGAICPSFRITDYNAADLG